MKLLSCAKLQCYLFAAVGGPPPGKDQGSRIIPVQVGTTQQQRPQDGYGGAPYGQEPYGQRPGYGQDPHDRQGENLR